MRQAIRLGNEVEGDLPVFRYQTLSQFMTLIEKSEMYLSRITTWDDKWEAPFDQLPTVNDDGTFRYASYNSRQDLFGQCWTSNGESDALWRIYSPNKEGVMIGTTAKKFLDLKGIHNGLFGKVAYSDFKEITEFPQGMLDQALVKRKAYEHENEYRLVTVFQEPEFANINYVNISVELNDFIESVTIDPRASKWFVEMVECYCKRANLNAPVVQSDLYSANVFDSLKIVKRWVEVSKQD
ncbi:DUF2971 domain-containing protein [Paenibacillus sp. NPDC058071]|uniref:DUF2971 domain-containing protein n=1 Tax=Paenibacillus sp. NPDC058071 TaxID=3346326 RepID=UPI0036D76939